MFGEHGWTNDKVNVITAIGNTTKILMDPHKTYVFFFFDVTSQAYPS